MAHTKVAVSRRALVARVDRALRKEGKSLRRARGAAALELGEYFVLDTSQGFVAEKGVDVEALARKLDLLHAWEEAK